MVRSLALAVSLLAQQAGFSPNYADRLLSPTVNDTMTPRLFPARRTLPIRVGVVFDASMITDERLSLVRAACGKWAAATLTQPREFKFDFVQVATPQDADIIFKFVRRSATDKYRAYTHEERGWASILLAVEGEDGKALTSRSILRIATHEIGHALGIWGHSPDPADVMSLSEDATDISVADVNTLELAYLNVPGLSASKEPVRSPGP